MAQENLANTEISIVDLTQIHASNPGVNFVKIFLGTEKSVDACNSHNMIGSSNQGSSVSFDPQTGDMTINVITQTAGLIQSTLRGCSIEPRNVDAFVSYQILKAGNKDATVEISHPEGFEVRYKLVTETDYMTIQ